MDLIEKKRKAWNQIKEGDYIAFKSGKIRKVIKTYGKPFIKCRPINSIPSQIIRFYTHNSGASKDNKTADYNFSGLRDKISAILKPKY